MSDCITFLLEFYYQYVVIVYPTNIYCVQYISIFTDMAQTLFAVKKCVYVYIINQVSGSDPKISLKPLIESIFYFPLLILMVKI